MVRHVRVRLVNGLCHGLTDVNGFGCVRGLIDDESCPREVGQRTASRHGFTDGSGLIGFADFVGVAQTFHIIPVWGRRGGVWAWRMFGHERGEGNGCGFCVVV
jgi:hypothetical protein